VPGDDDLEAMKDGEEITPSTLEISLKSCMGALYPRCRRLAEVEEAVSEAPEHL
jgi:hypothetical protein